LHHNQTACEASGLSQSSFFLWIEKGEQGQSPYKEFSEAVTRARGRAKARIVRSLLDESDWRPRLEILARVFPGEYGRSETCPLPATPPPPIDMSRSVRFTVHGCGDVDVAQFFEMKLKLEAAGIKTDFSVKAPESSAAHDSNNCDNRKPVIVNGRLVGWREPDDNDDEDEDGNGSTP
jgi:hypothetical protein